MHANSFYDSLWDIARKNEEDYRIALGFARGFQDHYKTLAQEFTARIYEKLETALKVKSQENSYWQAWEMSLPLEETKSYALSKDGWIGFRLKGTELHVGIEPPTGAQNIYFGLSIKAEYREGYFSAGLMEALNTEFGTGGTTPHFIWWRYYQSEYRSWNNDVALVEIWRDLHGTTEAGASFSDTYVNSLMRCLEILESNTGPKWPTDAGAK